MCIIYVQWWESYFLNVAAWLLSLLVKETRYFIRYHFLSLQLLVSSHCYFKCNEIVTSYHRGARWAKQQVVDYCFSFADKGKQTSVSVCCKRMKVPWRPCSYSPIHNLTVPMGQPFTSGLGGYGSCPRDALTLTMEPGSPVSNVSLHWWPQRNWSQTSLQAERFTRLPCHMVTTDITWLPQFHSECCRSLLLFTTYWPVTAPVKLLGGRRVEALQLQPNIQSHWSSGLTICFPPIRATVCFPGMHSHIQWNRILLIVMSRYSLPFPILFAANKWKFLFSISSVSH